MYKFFKFVFSLLSSFQKDEGVEPSTRNFRYSWGFEADPVQGTPPEFALLEATDEYSRLLWQMKDMRQQNLLQRLELSQKKVSEAEGLPKSEVQQKLLEKWQQELVEAERLLARDFEPTWMRLEARKLARIWQWSIIQTEGEQLLSQREGDWIRTLYRYQGRYFSLRQYFERESDPWLQMEWRLILGKTDAFTASELDAIANVMAEE